MTIEDIIADFRKLETLDAEIATQAAPRLEAIVKKTAAAGMTPDGQPWKPRKKDGGRPLEHAEERIRSEVNGSTIVLVVGGPEYWHQKAKPGASLPQRKVIPSAGDPLPDSLRTELDAVTSETIAKVMRGAA